MTVDPSGKFAYVPNAYDPNNTVSQYTIDSVTGVLTPNTPSSVTAGNQPTDVAVDPSSKFAYVVNRADNTISIFTIDSNTGNMTPMTIVTTGGEPFRVVVDPSGKFVYAANEAGRISVYTLGSGGMLTPAGTVTTANGGSLSVKVVANPK